MRFLSYENARISPKPDPKVPILIGGRSEAALKRTAKYGEGWLGVWVSPERFEKAVRDVADLNGRPMDARHSGLGKCWRKRKRKFSARDGGHI